MSRTQVENDYLEAVALARDCGLILGRRTAKTYDVQSVNFGWLLHVRGDRFYWDQNHKGPHLPIRSPFTIKDVVMAVIEAEANYIDKAAEVERSGSSFALDSDSQCTSCGLPSVVQETGLCEECTTRCAAL